MNKYNFTNDKPITEVEYVEYAARHNFDEYPWADAPFFAFTYDADRYAIVNLFSEIDMIEVYKLDDADDIGEVVNESVNTVIYEFDFIKTLIKECQRVYKGQTAVNYTLIKTNLNAFKYSLEEIVDE